MPVRRPKQSDRFAATLYSPPETWISTERACGNGITPGSSRCTSAPSARKSRAHASLRILRPLTVLPRCRDTSGIGDSAARYLAVLLVAQRAPFAEFLQAAPAGCVIALGGGVRDSLG